MSVGKSADVFNRDVMQSLKQFGQFHSILSTRKDSQRDPDQAVPQTDTGGLVEKTKVSERKRLKELGKKAGRNFGRCPALCGASRARLQQMIANRLFIKNTGPCKAEMQSIRADTCPVPVS